LGNRKALDIAVVGVAAAVEMNGSEIIRNSSIALASVAPKPIRIDEASQAIHGKELNRETAQIAAKIARDQISPIDDQRGSAEYRFRMVEELVERALMNCLSSYGKEVNA
jgi:CO/xanthine dehydrogenase FAD-binding subunit